jgi:hypothetical protein
MSVSSILGGIAGGLVGALIWVLVGYFTGYEVGYIAWGVGLFAGVGLRYFAAKAEIDESAAQGVAAAVIALACVLVGKFGVAFLVVENAKQEVAAEMAKTPVSDEQMISKHANDIVIEREKGGNPVKEPSDEVLFDDDIKNDFPKDVWAEADRWWRETPAADRQAAIQKATADRNEFFNAMVPDAMSVFKDSFAFWDLLWVFFAVGTAYKIGAGTATSES